MRQATPVLPRPRARLPTRSTWCAAISRRQNTSRRHDRTKLCLTRILCLRSGRLAGLLHPGTLSLLILQRRGIRIMAASGIGTRFSALLVLCRRRELSPGSCLLGRTSIAAHFLVLLGLLCVLCTRHFARKTVLALLILVSWTDFKTCYLALLISRRRRELPPSPG
jgi:hypothetical protein